MKKRILSLVLVLSMIASFATVMPLSASAKKLTAIQMKNQVLSGEHHCAWVFYQDAGKNQWYISYATTGRKWPVLGNYSIGEHVAWLEVGRDKAKINSDMSKITIDGGLSSNYDRNVLNYSRLSDATNPYSANSSDYVYCEDITNARKNIEGDTVDIDFYFFAVGDDWYIVGKDGKVSHWYDDIPKTEGGVTWYTFGWNEIPGFEDEYAPVFRDENGYRYVKFESKPRLEGYASMPSQIPQGEPYYVKGKIMSDTPIEKVTVNIFSRNDKAKSLHIQKSVYPNTYSYDLSDIDDQLHFTQYPAGEMEIQIWAKNASGPHNLIEQDGHGEFFSIVGHSNNNINSSGNNIVINGVDIGYKTGQYFSETGKECACHGRGTCGEAWDCTCIGVSQAWQCKGFAMHCQNKLFGGNEKSHPSKFKKIGSVAKGKLTETKIKELILAAPIGSHIRTNSSPHSMILISKNNNGFTIVQANGGNNNEYNGYDNCRIGTSTYTWESYVNSTYGQRGIEYIAVPQN